MSSANPALLSVTGLSALLRSKQVSPVDLVESYLERIRLLNDKVHAYITICEQTALDEARQAEKALANGHSLGPLHGIPIGIKDQVNVRGVRTTNASVLMADYVAQEDATLVQRLRAAGAIVLGKLNLSEFALGGNITNPFGVPRNPWNLDYQPGHSSSGSGIAVAASLCATAIAEDTSGSLRIPAAWCGVTGLRPTWGRVSRHGMFTLAWSMDQAGPMAKTVEDCALVFRTIAGYDPKDPYTSHQPVPLFEPREHLKGLRIGVVREAMDNALVDPEVREAVGKGIAVLEEAGASLREVSIPLAPHAGVITATITDVEASVSHQGWLRTRAQEYDFATRRRLLAASLVPASLYVKALRLRTMVQRQVMAALEQVDVLVAPTQPIPAVKVASVTGLDSAGDVLRKFFWPRAGTAPFNLAGAPALSVPCGLTAAGLPVGMQIAGRPFDEGLVMQVGHAYQIRTSWHTMHPPL